MLTIWGDIEENIFILEEILFGWEQANFNKFLKNELADYII